MTRIFGNLDIWQWKQTKCDSQKTIHAYRELCFDPQLHLDEKVKGGDIGKFSSMQFDYKHHDLGIRNKWGHFAEQTGLFQNHRMAAIDISQHPRLTKHRFDNDPQSHLDGRELNDGICISRHLDSGNIFASSWIPKDTFQYS